MIKFFRKRLDKKGFTLVELLIVIAVLGIIAGIAVPSMSGVTNTFKRKADVETAKIAARQIEVYTMSGFYADGTKVETQTATAMTADQYGEIPNSQLNGGSMTLTLTVPTDVTDDCTLEIKSGTDIFFTGTINGLIN